MWEKGDTVECIQPTLGLTVGKTYTVIRFIMGQSAEFDRIEINANDAGVIKQVFFASNFKLLKGV